MPAVLTQAPLTSFDSARHAILQGRPGVWFCATEQIAIEPWIVATIHADRLCWRDYSRDTDQGEAFEAPWTWTESFRLLQCLWDTLAAPAGGHNHAHPNAIRPALPVWLTYELGACLEPAVLRRTAGRRPAEPATTTDLNAHPPLAGFLIPRAWAHKASAASERTPAQWVGDPTGQVTGKRLCQLFTAAVLATRIPAAAPVAEPHAVAPTALSGPLAPDDLAAERTAYLQAVARVQDYIRAGDVYQVNVTRRIACRASLDASPAVTDPTAGDWFRAILARHPAEQASFWSHIGGSDSTTRHFLSFTPERLLSIRPLPAPATGETLLQLHTSPIKGTRPRPRDASPLRLKQLADELMSDPKEQAELNMIIDMARNDLGRVARTGSVRVISSGRIDPLPFVLHRVADVTAEAAAPLNLLSLLTAVFPGASVTGAPKIRAMQIIDELENTPRGIYCGALGWLGHGYTADLALAIRTLEAGPALSFDDDVATPNQAHTTPRPAANPAPRLCGIFGVGAGIVADSDADREWRETIAKSRGIVD